MVWFMRKIILTYILILVFAFFPAGVKASLNPADVDPQLLELARHGRLTVRALQGWGLLERRHQNLILELRSKRQLDALSANAGQIDAWLIDAKNGKLNLSSAQQVGVAEILRLFTEVQVLASSTSTQEETPSSFEPPPGEIQPLTPNLVLGGSLLQTDSAVRDGKIFVMVRGGTKDAIMKVADYTKGRVVLDLQASAQIINDFVTRGHVEEEKGILGFYIDFLSPTFGGIEAFTYFGTGGGAFAGALGSVFGDFGAHLSTNISTNAGYLNLLIAAVQTYDDVTTKGWQNSETGAQVYKNILGNFSTITSLIRGPYVTSTQTFALNLGFAGAYVFGFTLDSLVDEAKSVRSATIKAVHKAYYSEGSNFHISDDGWYGIFAGHYDAAMQNSSDPSDAFQVAYSGMLNKIEKYLNGYWMHGENDIFTVLEAGRRFNYDATPEEREQLNAVSRQDLYQRLNTKVLPRIQRFMLTRFSEEAANAMDKMCDPMNTRCRIRVLESQPDELTERTYAGYEMRFGHVAQDGQFSFATGEGWIRTLPALDEDPVPVDVEMTVLGYMQCGAPNALLLFKPGTDSNDPKSAERSISFQQNRKFLEIDIRPEPNSNVWALTRIEPYKIKQFGKYSFENLPQHMEKTLESSAGPTSFKLEYTEIIRWKDKETETRKGSVDFTLPPYFKADVDGSLSIKAKFTLNDGFVDHKGENRVGMFVILDKSEFGAGTRVADETIDVTFSAQIEPGRMRQFPGGGIKRGAKTHTLDVGLWHATGMGISPEYGARYIYEWMPFSQAKGRQPEIKGR